jgi:hypothetical protein
MGVGSSKTLEVPIKIKNIHYLHGSPLLTVIAVVTIIQHLHGENTLFANPVFSVDARVPSHPPMLHDPVPVAAVSRFIGLRCLHNQMIGVKTAPFVAEMGSFVSPSAPGKLELQEPVACDQCDLVQPWLKSQLLSI